MDSQYKQRPDIQGSFHIISSKTCYRRVTFLQVLLEMDVKTKMMVTLFYFRLTPTRRMSQPIGLGSYFLFQLYFLHKFSYYLSKTEWKVGIMVRIQQINKKIILSNSFETAQELGLASAIKTPNKFGITHKHRRFARAINKITKPSNNNEFVRCMNANFVFR